MKRKICAPKDDDFKTKEIVIKGVNQNERGCDQSDRFRMGTMTEIVHE
jgi:hypothetical protein